MKILGLPGVFLFLVLAGCKLPVPASTGVLENTENALSTTQRIELEYPNIAELKKRFGESISRYFSDSQITKAQIANMKMNPPLILFYGGYNMCGKDNAGLPTAATGIVHSLSERITKAFAVKGLQKPIYFLGCFEYIKGDLNLCTSFETVGEAKGEASCGSLGDVLNSKEDLRVLDAKPEPPAAIAAALASFQTLARKFPNSKKFYIGGSYGGWGVAKTALAQAAMKNGNGNAQGVEISGLVTIDPHSPLTCSFAKAILGGCREIAPVLQNPQNVTNISNIVGWWEHFYQTQTTTQSTSAIDSKTPNAPVNHYLEAKDLTESEKNLVVLVENRNRAFHCTAHCQIIEGGIFQEKVPPQIKIKEPLATFLNKGDLVPDQWPYVVERIGTSYEGLN